MRREGKYYPLQNAQRKNESCSICSCVLNFDARIRFWHSNTRRHCDVHVRRSPLFDEASPGSARVERHRDKRAQLPSLNQYCSMSHGVFNVPILIRVPVSFQSKLCCMFGCVVAFRSACNLQIQHSIFTSPDHSKSHCHRKSQRRDLSVKQKQISLQRAANFRLLQEKLPFLPRAKKSSTISSVNVESTWTASNRCSRVL